MVEKHSIQRVAEALEQMGIGYEVGDKPPSRVEDSASLANLANCSVKTATNALTYLRKASGDVAKAIQNDRDMQNKQYATKEHRDIDIKHDKIAPAHEEQMGIPIQDIKPKKR